MNRTSILSMATMLLLFVTATPVDAGCCDRCGTTCTTQMICRTICVPQIVESGCWDEQCETICQPPKTLSVAGCLAGGCDACDASSSCDAGLACDAAFGACDDCAACGGESGSLFSNWSTLFGHWNKGQVRDRKRLVWKSYIEYVPKWECVVEELCGSCCGPIPPSMSPDPLAVPGQITNPAEASSLPVRLQISDQPPGELPARTDSPVPTLSQETLTLAPSTGPAVLLTGSPVLLQVSDQTPEEDVPSTGLTAGVVERDELLKGASDSVAPVRFQISDQLPADRDAMPLLLPADHHAEDDPASAASVSALAPIAPVVHSLSR